MSVKETMKRIEEVAEAQKKFHDSRQEEARKEANKIKKERYTAGLPEARRVQAELLEELRQVGVVPLLEEMAGPINPIEPSRKDDGSSEYRKYLVDSLLEGLKSVHRQFRGIWTPSIPLPEMRADGTPKPTLKIQIERVRTESMRPNMSPNFEPPSLSVNVEYHTDGRLIIAGEKTTFNKRVRGETNYNSEYEEVIAQAFLEPRVKWSDTKARSSSQDLD